ncbi:hypothetical protein SDC9_193094 [bioreactor metagenome]|uniref:Uncharacterized protein n=1 Tax=bioreactor metagenome TaxID=1076179 RepID=A0A645I2K0_9ZZZZ
MVVLGRIGESYDITAHGIELAYPSEQVIKGPNVFWEGAVIHRLYENRKTPAQYCISNHYLMVTCHCTSPRPSYTNTLQL